MVVIDRGAVTAPVKRGQKSGEKERGDLARAGTGEYQLREREKGLDVSLISDHVSRSGFATVRRRGRTSPDYS
jgi:hypothetical protein